MINAVWGEAPPRNAVNLVQRHVSGPRRVLEPERPGHAPSGLLAWTEVGYQLTSPKRALDLDVFDGGLSRARAARAAGQQQERIELDLAIGVHADLIAELRDLVARHPLRERSYGLLMLALYRVGRQADALTVFRDARRHLHDELGVEPVAALQQLHLPAAMPKRPTGRTGDRSSREHRD
jgi:Bacterial transcriptional activator domain